VSLTFDELPIE